GTTDTGVAVVQVASVSGVVAWRTSPARGTSDRLSSPTSRQDNVTDDGVVASSESGSGAGRVTSVDTLRSGTPRAALRPLSLPVVSSALTSYQTSSVSGTFTSRNSFVVTGVLVSR